MSLKFTDGEEFDLQGRLRAEKRRDSWYVMGEGMLIPVASFDEAQTTIATLKNSDKEGFSVSDRDE